MDIQKILELCVRYAASDVHIIVGVPPMLRLHGKLLTVPEMTMVTPAQAEALITPILNEQQRELVKVDRELDFSYGLPSGERFRANVYYEKGNLAAALRYIPAKIRTLEELHLPSIVGELTQMKQGLVLVTGPTGHGKST